MNANGMIIEFCIIVHGVAGGQISFHSWFSHSGESV